MKAKKAKMVKVPKAKKVSGAMKGLKAVMDKKRAVTMKAKKAKSSY